MACCGFAQEVDYGVGHRGVRLGHLIRGSLARGDGEPAGVTFDEASQRISGVFLEGRKVAEADGVEVKLEEFLQGAHSLLGRVGDAGGWGIESPAELVVEGIADDDYALLWHVKGDAAGGVTGRWTTRSSVGKGMRSPSSSRRSTGTGLPVSLSRRAGQRRLGRVNGGDWGRV